MAAADSDGQRCATIAYIKEKRKLTPARVRSVIRCVLRPISNVHRKSLELNSTSETDAAVRGALVPALPTSAGSRVGMDDEDFSALEADLEAELLREMESAPAPPPEPEPEPSKRPPEYI